MQPNLSDHILQIAVYIILIAVILYAPQAIVWVYNILVEVLK